MNAIINQIKKLEKQIVLDESELDESKMEEYTPENIGKKLPREAALTAKIYSQKVENLQLRMYLSSIATSIKEELKTFKSYNNGNYYRVEDIENMVRSLMLKS